jgi:putative cell wall-binding protein
LSIRTQRTSKRIVAAIAAAGIAATTVAITSPASAAQTVTESRVFGADRYATAAAVATATFTGGSNNIILASGENFPDGLAASGLAGFANAPVLLTTTNALPASTAGAIATLDGLAAGAATIHIIGGEAAVSATVRAQLTALGYKLNELDGADRYATSAAVAEFAAANLGSIGQYNGLRTAIVATGANFADALTAGAPAFAGRHPILLTAPTALPQSVSDALTAISAQQVIVLGGTAAVSADVATAIQAKGLNVIRLQGANRYETAKAVADAVIDPLGFNFYGTAPQETVLVSGEVFADALAAGPHAGTIKAPMLLVQPCALPAPTKAFHTANSAVIDLVRAIGGTSAICDETLKEAVAAATIATPTATLVAEQGRNFIDVTFSEAMLASTFVGTDIAVASPGRTATIGAVTTLPTAGLTQATTYRVAVTFSDALGLNPGDTAVLAAGSVQTPPPGSRSNAAASVTVAPDTTRPTATLTPVVGANNFFVVFSEPMGASALAAASYNATAGIAGAATAVGSTNTVFSVPTTNPIAVGQTVSVLGAGTPPAATGALDLAGNPVVPTSRTVVADTVNPFMQSASLTNTNTAQRSVDNGFLQFNAIKGSAADGAAGNAYSWTFVNVDGATPTVSGPSSTGVFTVRGDFDITGSPANTTVQVATAWQASAGGSLFQVLTLGPTMNGAAAAPIAALAGTPGLTTSTIVVQFNEGVQAIANGDIEVYASNTAGAASIPTTATTPATAIDGKVTMTVVDVTNPTLLPKAGTAVARTVANAIVDLSGNLNAAQTVTINAAS